MHNVNATKRVAEVELKEGLEGNRSWHHRFRHSAYVFVGGLDPRLTEGDVVIVFSQFGEVVDIHMKRDPTTGKSRGHAYVCYEDQRSTILAVDNMNGCQLLNRTLRVDHSDFKAPKVFDEEEKDEQGDPKLKEYKASGAEGAGHEVYNVLPSQRKLNDIQEEKKSRQVKPAAIQDEDEAWAKAFDENLKKVKESAKEGKAKKGKSCKYKKELREIKRMKKEAKMLKEEMKKAKEAAKLAKGRKRSGKDPKDKKESKREDKREGKKEGKKEGKPKKESKNEGKKQDSKRRREEAEEEGEEEESSSESGSDDSSVGTDSSAD